MNLWDYLRETPDERTLRKKREAKQKPKRKTVLTKHPDDHYGFDGLNAYAAKQRKGKH